MKKRFFRLEDYDVVERIEELAMEKGIKPAQIALAWLFHKKHITAPILGATRVEHVEEAVEALDIKLSSTDMERLEEPYKPHPILGHS